MPEATPTPDPAAAPAATATDEAAKAELEKWKAMSRKNEERAKENAEAAKRAEELQKRLDDLEAAKLTDAEKAERRLRDLEASVKSAQDAQKAAELSALKARIGAEKGVPAAFIDRLQGDDEASIAADADAILSAIPNDVRSQWPELGQGDRGKPVTKDPLEAALRSKLGIPT
jgi:DNA repair ATPase RecN